jgi:hypothetical protein
MLDNGTVLQDLMCRMGQAGPWGYSTLPTRWPPQITHSGDRILQGHRRCGVHGTNDGAAPAEVEGTQGQTRLGGFQALRTQWPAQIVDIGDLR